MKPRLKPESSKLTSGKTRTNKRLIVLLRLIALLLLVLCLTFCKHTEEVELTIGEITFAGYQFEIIETKTIDKKTEQVLSRTVDTLLMIGCDHCEQICHDDEDYQDYRR